MRTIEWIRAKRAHLEKLSNELDHLNGKALDGAITQTEENRRATVAFEVETLVDEISKATSDSARETLDHLNKPKRLANPGPAHFDVPPASPAFGGGGGGRVHDRFACYGNDQPEMWLDTKTGAFLPALSKRHKLSVMHGDAINQFAPSPIGRLIQEAVTGRADSYGDLRAAMGGTPNWSGGYLVPEILEARFIDNLRNRIVLSQAGAKTIPLAGTTSIARIASDPTFTIFGENDEITESSVTLDNVNFVPRKLAALIYCSRELMDDAANGAAVIEASLINGLAAAFDEQALCGTGAGATMIGCMNISGVTTTDSNVGSIASSQFDEILDAIEDVENANDSCNAIISTPAVRTLYRKLRSGDGTTSAKLYLDAPEPIRSLPWLTTTGAVAGELFVGNFATVLIGLRQGALLEVSKDAGDAFKKHQVAVKITLRADVNCEHATSLAKLQGITA